MATPLPQRPPYPTPPERSGGEIGLSTAHISNPALQQSEITAYARGGYVILQPAARLKHGRAGGGKRKRIGSFSKHSRRRLLRLIGTIDQTAALPLFITLTYPAQFPTARESKRHLNNFLTQLRQAYPAACGIWRLEAQKRGAPHYHLLLWGVGFIPKDWIARRWWTVCGCLSPEHLAAGTQVCRAKVFKRVWLYAGKYIAKLSDTPTDSTWIEPGRFWGIFNAAALPIAPAYKFPISDSAYYQMRRAIRRRLGIKPRYNQAAAVHLFSDNPTRWIQLAAYYHQE